MSTRPARCGTGWSSRSLLTVPVVVLAMVPALQFDYWQWLSLTLAAPGRGLGGVAVPPGRVAQPAPWHRDHGHADLRRCPRRVRVVARTPCSSAKPATRYDPWVLLDGRARQGASLIYLEVAAGVTMFILAGRYFEARAKRRSGAALTALLELGAKDVAVLRDGVEAPHPDR